MDFPEKLNRLRYACPDPSPDSSISHSEPKFANSKTLIKSSSSPSSSWQQSSIRSRHFLSSKPESFDPLLQSLTLLIGILHLLYLFLSNPIERERERELISFRFLCSFCSNSSRNENRALTKRFRRGLTERWDITQARELLKSRRRYSPKLFLIHVVKEGETLTSISRLYGVSIQSIVAVNASIVDVDFVLEGQCLNIPFRAEETKMDPGWKIQLDSRSSHEKCQSPLNSLAAPESCKLSRFLSSHHLQNAKPTGYFLVLVPLIAFCIRCIIGTIQHRVAKDLKHQAANKPKAHNQGSRSIRWKSVLSDSRDSDAADTESSQDSVNPPEDVTVPFEDISHAYTKLEPAYLKFLSECGMSKWGYWRGGSLE